MIIKGSSRGGDAADVRRLAVHLLDGSANEQVRIVQLRDCAATTLPAALDEMRAISLGTKTRRCLYHASINLAPSEAADMGAHWNAAVAELERGLGLVGHQRAVVIHCKQGRKHVHIVWCRVHPITLKTASDSWSYRVHERVARSLEQQLGLQQVTGVHTRPTGAPRPVARLRHREKQAADRTGVSVDEVRATVQSAWTNTTTAAELKIVLAQQGYRLERGSKTIIVIDPAGTPHALARRLGIKVALVRARLTDLDLASTDLIETGCPMTTPARPPPARVSGRDGHHRAPPLSQCEDISMTNQTYRRTCGITATNPESLQIDLHAILAIWLASGQEAQIIGDSVVIFLPDGEIRDNGSSMTLSTDAVTDQQIRLMLQSSAERGWTALTLTGDEEFQRRTLQLAIQMGYSPDDITTTCPLANSISPGPAAPKLGDRLGRWRQGRQNRDDEENYSAPAP